MSTGETMTSDFTMALSSVAPLDVWIAIKTVLRRELGEREWEMWIQHARLWRVDHGCFAVLMPRKGKAIYGGLRYYKRVKALSRRMGFDCIMMAETDWDFFQLRREAVEALPADDPRRKKILRYDEEEALLRRPFLEPPCSEVWR
jgi:hypothetical protein